MLYYYIFYNICYMSAHPPDPKSAAVCIASFFAALLAAKYQNTLAQSILAYKDRFHNQFVYTCLYAASVFILAILLDTAWAWAYRPSFNVFILFSACFVLLALSILVNAILREDGTMAQQKMAQSNSYILGEKRSRESNSEKGSGGGEVDIKIQ